MTDKLTTFAKILSEQGFTDHRLRVIGGTNSVRLELRGLSEADMASFSDEPAQNGNTVANLVDKPAADAPPEPETASEPPESEPEAPKKGFFT